MKKLFPLLNGITTDSTASTVHPPTPWTMGMTRNLSYMQKWAGAMMRLVQ